MKNIKTFIIYPVLATVLLVLVGSKLFFNRSWADLRFAALGLFDSQFSYSRFLDLQAENLTLKNKLGELQSQLPLPESGFLAANVFAQYPFGVLSDLIIDKGEKDGVKPGMAVLAPTRILIGKISRVSARRSEVMTVFNPAWSSSVGIGRPRAKALLKGGNPPVITLISADAAAESGAAVFNLSPDFPYRLALGTLANVKPADLPPWFSGNLETPYAIDGLTQVFVLTE